MFQYQAPTALLKDKVILVTGAGDGIGKAAALNYAKHGATVILLGRTTSKLEKVYDEIEQNKWPQPAIIPLNLEGAVEKDYIEVANSIDTAFGRLDGILHNASLLGSMTTIDQYEVSVWEKVMQVILTKIFLPLLQASSNNPSIIFTSSSVGKKGRAFWGAYCVSKFATEGLMQLLADENDVTEPRIRVNCINPGATRTNMRADAYPAENPMNNLTPDEIMPLYLYLMGNDSLDITGQTLDAQVKQA
jgi:NAD(P)-dependent dehydrogenase (short-subunit alcohol dehydrogenase family)